MVKRTQDHGMFDDERNVFEFLQFSKKELHEKIFPQHF